MSRRIFLLLGVLGIILRSSMAWADEGGHLGVHSWREMGFEVFNFVVFMTILIALGMRHVPGLLQERQREISEELIASQEALSQAQQIHDTAATQMAELEPTLHRLWSNMQLEESNAQQKALKEAQDTHQRALQDAIARGKAQKLETGIALRHQFIGTVVQAAKQRIANQITPKEQQQISNKIVADLTQKFPLDSEDILTKERV